MGGIGLISKGWKAGKAIATGGWRTAGFLGTHTKGVLLTGGAAYGGWKYLSTGHLPGEELISKVGTAAGNTVAVVNNGLQAVNTTLGYVNDGLKRAPELISDTREALSDVGSTFTNAVGGSQGGGQGGSLLGNLFGGVSNLLGGLFNGGTGSLLGLVASAFMLFGGFGWMGKIGGILLAALSLGLFKGNSQSQQRTLQPAPEALVQPREAAIPTPINVNTEESGYTVHRSR